MAKKTKSAVVVLTGKEEVTSLLTLAVTEKVPVEILEKVMVMQNKIDVKIAKEAFNKDMAGFQGECPIIGKEKKVIIKGQTVYSYSPIETIAEKVRKLLQKYNFSYSFKIKTGKDTVEVECIAKHSMGHSESSTFKIPLGTQTGMMSDTQRVAAAATFAKRYALLNVFGIMTGGEDREENIQNPKDFQRDTLKEAKARLKKAKNEKELLSAWSDLPASAKKEPKIKKFKDELKAGLKDTKGRVKKTKGVKISKQEEKEILEDEKKL